MTLTELIGFIVEWPTRRKQLELNRERNAFTSEAFRTHYRNDGIDAGVVDITWHRLRAEASVDDFRPLPQDDIYQVFRIAEEDLDDLVLELLHAAGARIPSPAETETMVPVRTVDDLVRFVAQMAVEANRAPHQGVPNVMLRTDSRLLKP